MKTRAGTQYVDFIVPEAQEKLHNYLENYVSIRCPRADYLDVKYERLRLYPGAGENGGRITYMVRSSTFNRRDLPESFIEHKTRNIFYHCVNDDIMEVHTSECVCNVDDTYSDIDCCTAGAFFRLTICLHFI